MPFADIESSQFEQYEACILSGQMPDSDVHDLLQANAAFAEWYAQRMNTRATTSALRQV